MQFQSATRRDPAVDTWLQAQEGELGDIARRAHELLRACGKDVEELMHDGLATACVGKAAFAYVGRYTNHVNVGFYLGVELEDPTGLLEGTGKFMRHVKVRPGFTAEQAHALGQLVRAAYADIKARV